MTQTYRNVWVKTPSEALKHPKSREMQAQGTEEIEKLGEIAVKSYE